MRKEHTGNQGRKSRGQYLKLNKERRKQEIRVLLRGDQYPKLREKNKNRD
jgi:hypothetical protein